MANDRYPDNQDKGEVERSEEQLENRVDPEKVWPNPEQVERNRSESSHIYGERNRKGAA